MPAPRPQLRIVPLQPRRKPAVRAIRREPDAMRRHRFGLPDVRENPRRVAGGPWEAGW
jgi:hypothetical protein